jgi:alpha-tubulin suppressor-like RCC1 family protein
MHVAGWGQNTQGEIGAGYESGDLLTPQLAVNGGVAPVALTAGATSSLVLQQDGTVLGWGNNRLGQLGVPVTGQGNQINAATGPAGIVQLATGDAHSIGLVGDGTVETWGSSMCGTLGNGETAHGKEDPVVFSDAPVTLALQGVGSVAAGGAVCGVVFVDGLVAMWGENKHGQLGDGTSEEKPVPTMIQGLAGVVKFAIGGESTMETHTLFLMVDGTVKAAGSGRYGALGQGKLPGKGEEVLADSHVPIIVPSLTDIIDIAANPEASYFLRADGTLLACGTNTEGQLGTGEIDELIVTPVEVMGGVAAIAAGYYYCLALTDGFVYAWGRNEHGTVGDGTSEPKERPFPLSLTGVSAIAAGSTHALAILEGPVPAPPVTCTGGEGTLTVAWSGEGNGREWTVQIRNAKDENWERTKHLPADTDKHTFTGLSKGVRYEIGVFQDGIGGWGKRVVEGVPL